MAYPQLRGKPHNKTVDPVRGDALRQTTHDQSQAALVTGSTRAIARSLELLDRTDRLPCMRGTEASKRGA